MKSRYRGGGIGRVGSIGADVFTSTPVSTSCPPGQHYVADGAVNVSGLGACVPNTVTLKPLTLQPTAAAPAAAAPLKPLTFQPTAAAPTAAAAPAPAAAAAPCPALWPWWWLVVAAGLGGALGYYGQKNQKAVKRNAGRMAGQHASRIVNRASEAAFARLVG